jgi:hypothetical protein
MPSISTQDTGLWFNVSLPAGSNARALFLQFILHKFSEASCSDDGSKNFVTLIKILAHAKRRSRMSREIKSGGFKTQI